MTPDQYLQSVLQSHNMTHVRAWERAHIDKRTEVRHKLQAQYKGRIYSPVDSGSYAKSTGINVKFDMDLVIPFKRKEFASPTAMYDDVGRFLQQAYPGVSFRPQRVSFRLVFPGAAGEITLDIVPGLELHADTYEKNALLELCVTKPALSTIRTNIEKQIGYVKGNSRAQNVIKLLKIWKHYRNVPIKSFLLELLVIKALESTNVPAGLAGQVRAVLVYIQQHIEKVRLQDPGNPNNIVSDLLTVQDKAHIKSAAEKAIAALNDTALLSQHFKMNALFSA